MCGIGGCISPAGESPDRRALGRMADSLAHRGPDDSGIELDGNVGLLSTRLSIVDPGPSGHQPMRDQSGRWLLAFNGEVYNHRELRHELAPGGWRGHSDTETLAAGLTRWGETTFDRCNGPLAAAALDRQEGRLLLARDRFGKKPLYLARHDGTIWFASEIGALLAAGVPARARRDVLAHVAVRGWACGRATPFDGIDRVPPGALVSIALEASEVSERRVGDPARSVDPELARELEVLPRRVLVDRLEEAIRTAVRSRLMADVPLGTMCSGGLDSSLITAFARDEHGPLTAFNCSLVDEPAADERLWAERAAEALDVELETVVVGATDWRAALVTAVRDHEYPLASPSSVPIGLIADRAKRRGVSVLLTGEGADELFAGYPLLHARSEVTFLPGHVTAMRYGRAFGSGRIPLAPLLRAFGIRRPYASVEAATSSTEEAGALRTSAKAAYAHHSGARFRMESALLSGLSCSAFPFLLNRMDKDAMAASVETRVPFLDPAVVALALNLPLEARTQPLLKGVLRDVARRNLPRSIADRPKFPGMSFNARRCIEVAARPEFLRHGRLRDLLEMPDVRWTGLLAGSSPRGGLRLWSAEIWARLFLDGQSIERVESDLWAHGPGEARSVVAPRGRGRSRAHGEHGEKVTGQEAGR